MKNRNKKYTKELSSAIAAMTVWYPCSHECEETRFSHAKPMKGSRLIAIFRRAEFAPEYGDHRRKFDAMDNLMATIAETRHGNYHYGTLNIDPNARYYIWLDVDGNIVTYGFKRVRPKEWAWVVRPMDSDERIPFQTRDAAIAHADWAKDAYSEDFVVEYTKID